MRKLCLDVGNVLVNLNMEPFRCAISKQMNLSKAETNHFIDRIQKKQDLGITSVSDELVTHFNIKSEYIMDEIMDAWRMVIRPNIDSLTFFDNLVKKYRLEVALLSNIGVDHAKQVNEMINEWPNLKNAIRHFSCFVGARKPTPLYYKLFLDQNPQFKEALYLDDLMENIETGSKMGFNAYHYDLSITENFEGDKLHVEDYCENRMGC